MSKGYAFTPIGVETNKIISKLLSDKSKDNFNTLRCEEKVKMLGNDNSPIMKQS